METSVVIPLIIRGRQIEDDLVEFGSRGGTLHFRTPDVRKYMKELVLRDPLSLRDLYSLSLNEIIDFLEELGSRLDRRVNPHVAQAAEMLAKSSFYSAEMAQSTFDLLPAMTKRKAIEEFIDRNIGREYLDDWVIHDLSDRRISVRAFGARSIHVIAGNGPSVAMLTVIMNAVTRSDAIIKIPSNDPYFCAAIGQTMIEMAPDHPLTRHVSVAYWKGGDASIERVLYDPANVEKIVAWGGFSSMRSIREYLGPGLDLVALDPKISGSVIGREAFASETTMEHVAKLAAADIGYLNQGACGSARTLFVETGLDKAGIERANRFGQLVYEAIQDLPPSVSSVHPAFDPLLRTEIDGIRYSDNFRIFGGKGSEGAVIVSQEEEEVDFSERLDCRVANLVPVQTIADALRHITVHMQTIGVYPESLKQEIRNECAYRGAQRIMSLGHALNANWAGPHDAIEPLRRLVRWLREDSVTEGSGFALPPSVILDAASCLDSLPAQ